MSATAPRLLLSLAITLALSACGGSDGQLVLGGTIMGVTKPGLVLTNNGGSDFAVPPPQDGSGFGRFNFPELVSTDDRYNVEIKAKPDNVSDCTIENPSGRAAYHVYTVYITCTLKTHALSGSVGNLKGRLELVNGSDRVVLEAGATSFNFNKVAQDSPYTVAVLTQPAGQTCSVANGNGIMGGGDVSNVSVTCTP